jgi:hypothetical protein
VHAAPAAGNVHESAANDAEAAPAAQHTPSGEERREPPPERMAPAHEQAAEAGSAEPAQPLPAASSGPFAEEREVRATVDVQPPPIELPVVSSELPSDSGLVLVETTHSASADAPAEEAPRGRRARPPRVEIASEPLEMVETRKDDMPAASQ